MVSAHAHKANAQRTSDGVSLRGLAVGAAIIVFSIAFSMGVSFVVMRVGTPATAHATTSVQPGAPPSIEGAVKPQPSPADDIAAYRAQKRRMLNEYGWVDRQRGIARIPIEQAMALLGRQRAPEAPK